MQGPLTQFLKPLWEADLPFVCFKLPQAKQATVYHQNDEKLHTADQLKAEGFIMAPFDLKDEIFCIPNRFSKVFDLGAHQITPKTAIQVKYTETEKSSFEKLIRLAKKEIYNKGLRKVVLSHSQKFQTKRNLIELFDELLHLYPEAMVYLWHHPKVGTWFGASPEQFITSEKDYAYTMALAGTQARSINKPPKWTKKEIEEQALVGTQIEEDLHQIFTSDQITKSQTQDFYIGDLIHIATNFKFPNQRKKLYQLAKTLHPTPAVGGVPTKKAIQFIKEKETYNRAFYTGFFGPISNEEFQLFVNLRCAQWTPDAVLLYAGAGITALSDPALEWEETQKKVKILATVL